MGAMKCNQQWISYRDVISSHPGLFSVDEKTVTVAEISLILRISIDYFGKHQ
uniref:Uncharacterized protein n=1 Tax=Octopus bimaculoides TaxID=37653 RepID=A0A0L8GTG9_OCTBM